MTNYFQAEQISKSFGEKVLFREISFSVFQGDKLGLIARNGSGKTTLLNIIAGLDQPDQGKCSYKNDLRIAYLKQEPDFDPDDTVADAILFSDNDVTRTVREYEEFMQETGDQLDEKAYQAIMERMDALEAWDYEQRIRQVLTRLKIGDLKARVGDLSGGQQKRLALARILIGDADFILLDEPTNHLDIDMIEWLESYLGRQKLTLLVITHDRYFLDAVCQGILELDDGEVYTFPGNYARFLEKKQERLQEQTARSDKALNLLRKEQEWMRRSPPARTTKSKARIDAFYELKEQSRNRREHLPGEIRVEMARLGNKILELQGLEKSFGALRVLHDFSHVFKKGERIGIAGPNGSGKTTLLNVITGQLQPDKGSVTRGETLVFGYYRQDGLQVDEGRKVIDVITDIAESIDLGNGKVFTAAQLLHYFNFSYKAQHDQAARLSGGEKRRLYLITVLMQKPNFLILDEPTNDLDIETLNVLEDFLQGFPGCLLVVSHDRYFLDRLTDHLLVFEHDGQIRGYTGNYTAYRLKKAGEERAAEKTRERHSVSPAGGERKPARTPREKKKRTYREQQEFDRLEQEIETLEHEKDLLLDQMNSGSLSPDDMLDASRRFGQITAELERKGDRWLELAEWE